MSEASQHLDDGILQEYLENALDPGHRATVGSHLAICTRCSARLEGWQMLLEELGGLERFQPSGQLAPGVIAQLTGSYASGDSLWARATGLLMGRSRRRHVTDGALQDLVEGLVQGSRATRIRRHLDGCERCSGSYLQWRRLGEELEGLQRLDPSRGFADAVMSRVAVEARRGVRSPTGWLETAGALMPASRRNWTLASAFMVSPVAAMLALAALVFVHPLLTARGLVTFGIWWVSGLLQAGAGWIWGSFSGSALAIQSYALVQTLLSSPGITLAVLLAVWSALVAATWVLYRNVLATPSSIASRHG